MTTSDLKIEIGKRVHDFRIKNNYTQAQFAEMMDVSVNFLSEIENGKKGMSQETICKLCNHFHISADYILFGTDVTPSASKSIIEIASNLDVQDLNLIIEYLVSLQKVKNLNL